VSIPASQGPGGDIARAAGTGNASGLVIQTGWGLFKYMGHALKYQSIGYAINPVARLGDQQTRPVNGDHIRAVGFEHSAGDEKKGNKIVIAHFSKYGFIRSRFSCVSHQKGVNLMSTEKEIESRIRLLEAKVRLLLYFLRYK